MGESELSAADACRFAARSSLVLFILQSTAFMPFGLFSYKDGIKILNECQS